MKINTLCMKSFLLFLIFGWGLKENRVYAQRIYANAEQHSTTQFLVITLSQVTNTGNASESVSLSNFSTLFTTLGALGLIEAWQNLQFGTAPPASSPVIIKYGGNASLLSLLDGTVLQPTNNGSLVGSPYTQSTLLGLLGLGVTDAEIMLPAPNVAYNGIRLKVSSTLLGAALTAKYYYAFYVAAPVSSNRTICSGSTTTFTISNPQTGYVYKWYNATMDTLLQNSAATSFTTTALSSSASYNVVAYESSNSTAYSSGRTIVSVTVNPFPQATVTTPTYVCHGLSVFKINYSNTLNNPDAYAITWNAQAQAAGFNNISYTSLPASPVSVILPVTAAVTSYQGVFLLRNSNNCVSTYPFSLMVQNPPDPHATTTFQ